MPWVNYGSVPITYYITYKKELSSPTVSRKAQIQVQFPLLHFLLYRPNRWSFHPPPLLLPYFLPLQLRTQEYKVTIPRRQSYKVSSKL